MSTLEDLEDLENENKQEQEKKTDGEKATDGDAEMEDADEGLVDDEILRSSVQDITMRRRLLENDLRIMRSETQRLRHEKTAMLEKIKDNQDKITNNRYDHGLLPLSRVTLRGPSGGHCVELHLPPN